ncbi:MAG: hypothetical protein ACFE8B_09975 [Candidatus Hermodarchaeota archaeon]
MYFSFMILNDLKAKVDGRFSKEIIIDDDGEELVYVFPDTREFISILRRKATKEVVLK